MPIYRMLQNSAFGPEAIECLGLAYQRALATFGLMDRPDELIEALAKLIIEIAKQTGERDPDKICAIALQLMNKDQVQLC